MRSDEARAGQVIYQVTRPGVVVRLTLQLARTYVCDICGEADDVMLWVTGWGTRYCDQCAGDPTERYVLEES